MTDFAYLAKNRALEMQQNNSIKMLSQYCQTKVILC